jgi:hypothetical protein
MNLIRLSLYIALGIIVSYFVLTNVNLMRKRTVSTDGEIQGQNKPGDPSDMAKLQKDLEEYGRQLLNNTSMTAQEISDHMKKTFKFKKPKETVNTEKESIMNTMLKYVTPLSSTMGKAPELENYEDYAPVDTPINNKKPILATNQTAPHALHPQPNAYSGVSGSSAPLPINEFENYQPAHFTGERRNAWNDKITGENLSAFFQNNPFKFFDELGKSDVHNPSDWEKIAKDKEKRSPLLGQPSMQQTEEGFMPSNHFQVDKQYHNIYGN